MGAPGVMAAAHGISSHEPEPTICHRRTKGKRDLWYCLKVIQQPERARACGSGPKSSADRRPVDPPPVVELRIFEGTTWENAQNKDITFLYNANFFLYATLEHARVMAHGRVQTPAANSPPVLTGMPVSGMAYLDRPQEAGYFLFPDLSVRHEGRYKLTFNLYEETKEDDDKDPDSNDAKPLPGMNSATGGSFDFRMEVKSQDFVVYSAKKFPGLTESTALSRTVAEQGCRVRIRRDVRMRRREGKGGSGGNDYETVEDEYTRRRRTATPDRTAADYRQRSMSGSMERAPYASDPQRRPSMADYPPQFSASSTSSGGHLQFLGGNANAQYPPQPQPFAQPPSIPASPVYPPSQGSYSATSSYPPPPPPPQAAYTPERTSSQSYAPLNPSPRRESVQQEQKTSFTLPPISNLTTLPPPQQQPQQQQQQQQQQQPHTSMPTLPPLKINTTNGGRYQPLAPSPTSVVPLPPVSTPSSAGFVRPQPPPQVAGTKRTRDETFKSDDTVRYQDKARDKGEAHDLDALNQPLQYKRATGEVKWVLPLPCIP